MKSYVRMVRHDARPAPESLSRYQLYNMHNEKQGSRQEDYDKLTRLKTTESLRMRAYVLMYNQQLCAHGQAGYMQLLLFCESLWLATSAKCRTDLKVEMKSKEGRKIKIKLSGKKTSLR